MSLNCHFDEELQVLQAIYMDDLIVSIKDSVNATIQITLHPSTGDNSEKKFVCLTLQCVISHKYPDKEPLFTIKNPRGLSDAHIVSIEENLSSLASQKVGDMMLFDLLEYAKESLTDNNHPSCVCPVCLEYFKEGENFFRTECYHYFHYPCIKGYINSIQVQEKCLCPVCRCEVPTQDVETILSFEFNSLTFNENNGELKLKNNFILSNEYKKWLAECKSLYDKQKEQGGIIDVEYERNKYLIPSSTSSTTTLDVGGSNSFHQQQQLDASSSVESTTSCHDQSQVVKRKSKRRVHQNKKESHSNNKARNEDCSQEDPHRTTQHRRRNKDEKTSATSNHVSKQYANKNNHTFHRKAGADTKTCNTSRSEKESDECFFSSRETNQRPGSADHTTKKRGRQKRSDKDICAANAGDENFKPNRDTEVASSSRTTCDGSTKSEQKKEIDRHIQVQAMSCRTPPGLTARQPQKVDRKVKPPPGFIFPSDDDVT